MATDRFSAKTEGRVFVDLSEKAKTADIVREGHKVPAVLIDKQQAEFVLGNLGTVDTRLTPRVIGQSIPAGSTVPSGSTVDLVLAPTASLPFDIFTKIHRSLRGRPIDQIINNVLDDPRTRQIVLKYDSSDQVTAAERAVVEQRLRGQADVAIDDADPETSFDAAFESLRGAAAFR